MDVDISHWILEFIIRQPIEDRLVNALLSVLPLPDDDTRLKKSILLRRISSEISTGSVSERTLDSLEMIEDLDYKKGNTVLDSMKAAYCAVAVDCTVKFLRENLDGDDLYFNAVKKIWRRRIHQMEIAENVGLVSEQLKDWKEEIEAATWDETVCEKISMKDTRYDALKLVRIYLEEAWEDMGPSFLELAASMMTCTEGGVQNGDNPSTVAEAGEEVHPRLAWEDMGPSFLELAASMMTCTEGGVQNGDNPSTVAEAGEEVHPRLDEDNGIASGDNCGNMAVDSVEKSREEMFQPLAMVNVGNGIAGDKYDFLPSPEVNGVLKALKSSCMELQAMVNDPLPDALDIAAKVVSDVESKKMNVEPSEEIQNVIDPVPKCLVDEGIGAVEAKVNTCRDRNARQHKDAQRPSLMERNNTACAYEWDADLIEGSPDGSPSSRKIILPSPKKRVVTPLKKHEMKNIARRRIKKWSSLEEETLRIAVEKYGKGNWKLILNSYRGIFEERTEVDLKDKWRNMVR